MLTLKDYEPIVGTQVLDELKLLGQKLSGKIVQHINSTAVGGGVAEILNRMLPLLKEVGVDARWDVIKGDDKFFAVTKKIHNAIHHSPTAVTPEEFDILLETNRETARNMNFPGDIIFVHDPQPIALVDLKKELGKKWIWRCHIDSSSPLIHVWDMLLPYIQQYDAAIFSASVFAQTLPIHQFLISPSIDPLSDKNRPLPREQVNGILDNFGLDRGRPIITQISRFDRLKDPCGVVEVYQLVKKYTDCQLVLAGGGAADDPEGEAVLAEVREKAANDPDVHILLLPPDSNIEINALQRGSDVIIQKSLKEGFGLTVSEALWKETPVVASAVGGIPLQISHQFNGLLASTIEGIAYNVRQFLHNPKYARLMAQHGKEHVRQNFLITRHLRDYLLLFQAMEYPNQDFVHL